MIVTAPIQEVSARPNTSWDSRVILLAGEDRQSLRARVDQLITHLESQRSVQLGELAATHAARLQPGGVRLAIVAVSQTDLMGKLRRAAERIVDNSCQQLRDTSGIYFTVEPLAQCGTVAVLYPGEGAQYIDMLADLCDVFPEVEATFSWCDRLAQDAGQPSLRNLLHLPHHASPEQRHEAENELRKLGPSIFSVLVADLALTRVLGQLELPVSAVAGHSAGELAALLASGAMPSESSLSSNLTAIMELMQQQEEAAGGPDVTLLAVGAGVATVKATTSTLAADDVVVAMDNCPHQCVLVGPSEAVASVEAILIERGIFCERLPFRRPYHTSLFEPWMGPFRRMFADIPFSAPQIPIYCCSTGERFPPHPDAIRELAVNHWVRPVEFTRMIEQMYADGVRLFIEAGPRGNLTAFVDDILRGRTFLAIPTNLSRKSGPTQINHLVAQLIVHHVPLKLDCLFEDINRGDTTLRSHVRDTKTHNNVIGDTTSSSNRSVATSDSTIISQYLAVMEQYLDVQREVMNAYLAGEPVDEQVAELIYHKSHDTHYDAIPAQYALVDTIVDYRPGHSIIFRRPLDSREDLYADHHTLGGRGVSRVDPGQNGLPVLPMTFSLEAMAEAAMLLAPEMIVSALRDIRLYRWIPFDAEPTTLEVRASVISGRDNSDTIEVKATVRDLGNSFLRDGANKPASEAIVVLRRHYSDPPEPLPFKLSNESPCRATVVDLRRNMFHGPLFQMIRSLDRFGKEGIEGTLEVQPRSGWLASNPDPRIVLDPVLIDAAMHILGAWHLEQPDWSGRILLPIGVNSLELFGPSPAIGSRLLIRGHNEVETARQVQHGLEVFDESGRVWLRLRGAGYWRFYLPFGEVNFFGPKDNYFLSQRCAEAVPPGVPNACCYYLDPPLDLRQAVLRASGVRVTMSPREIAEYDAIAADDAQANDWYFSRLVAKDAVRGVWSRTHSVAMFPADMEVDREGGRFVVRPRDPDASIRFPSVAVAVCDGKVAAFAADVNQLGIGLISLPKKPDAEVIVAACRRAACLALADAWQCSCEEFTAEVAQVPGLIRVRRNSQPPVFLVQTVVHHNSVIATTVCEVDSQ